MQRLRSEFVRFISKDLWSDGARHLPRWLRFAFIFGLGPVLGGLFLLVDWSSSSPRHPGGAEILLIILFPPLALIALFGCFAIKKGMRHILSVPRLSSTKLEFRAALTHQERSDSYRRAGRMAYWGALAAALLILLFRIVQYEAYPLGLQMGLYILASVLFLCGLLLTRVSRGFRTHCLDGADEEQRMENP
jgi:hypothetical protein